MVTAGLLARQGARVTLLERRSEVGAKQRRALGENDCTRRKRARLVVCVFFLAARLIDAVMKMLVVVFLKAGGSRRSGWVNFASTLVRRSC